MGIFQIVGDLIRAVHDRRMIPAPQRGAYGFQRIGGELAAQIHGDLPGINDILRFFLGLDIFYGNAVIFADGLDDSLAGDDLFDIVAGIIL